MKYTKLKQEGFEMKSILLCCAAGMSTSLLVTKMQEASRKEGFETTIWATPAEKLREEMAGKKIDVVLLGPQIRYQLPEVKKVCDEKNIPCDSIVMTDYGTMNGKKVLDFAKKLMKI